MIDDVFILGIITGGHGKSKIKYTNLIVKMDRLSDPPGVTKPPIETRRKDS
jgi:hypothetical protein